MAKATYQIIYENKDVTRLISAEVQALTYVDKTVGEADELTLTVKDEDHKWKNSWNPQKGDTIQANIITDSGTLPCGTFSVTTLRFNGSKESGHSLEINALGAGVLTAVRTKSSFAHEGKTLQTITEKIAAKYGYKVQGIIHNYSIARVTQFHETDLEFLHRVAQEYGYIFSLRGNTLVFTYLPELNAQAGAIPIQFTDIISYTIVDNVAGIYVRGQNRYHNPKTKSLYDSLVESGAITSADAMRLQHHVDNNEQGLYKVDGRLYKKNLTQTEIDATTVGNILIVSGNNATLKGAEWGVYADTYFIGESRHAVTPEGDYVTSAQYKKLAPNKPTGNAPGDKVGY